MRYMQDTREAASEISVVEQLAGLAATIRDGKRVDLAAAASRWELRLQRQKKALSAQLNGKSKAKNNFPGAVPATSRAEVTPDARAH